MDLKLKDKLFVLTGGSHGIGLAIKNELEREGALVKSISRTDGYDLTKEEDLIRTLDYIKENNVSGIINNFGGGGTWSKDWRLVFYRNLEIMKVLTDKFLDQKKHWGRVITISSIYGKEKGPNEIFTAAKSAQIAYMKSLSGKYPGTTFNTVCPGHIDVGKPMPGYSGNPGKPEDVAGIVTFLCSNKTKWINGAVITVDNGESYSF